MQDDDNDIVYSTEEGDLRTQRKGSQKSGKKQHKEFAKDHVDKDKDGAIKVRREKKGRGGKTVTAVYGVPLAEDKLKELGKNLKQACGSGGSVKDGVIEIQGDETDRVIDLLKKEGFSAKKAGG